MKRIIIDEKDRNTIKLSEVNIYNPIFAKKDNILKGMIVYDSSGWYLCLGRSTGATGYHSSLKECIESCLEYDYEFFVELRSIPE